MPALRVLGPAAGAAARARGAVRALHDGTPPLRSLRPKEPHARLQEIHQRHLGGKVCMRDDFKNVTVLNG